MDLDSALDRYLANPQVARWLFSTHDIRTVSAHDLDASFVYAIGFGAGQPGKPRAMDIEDMLIVTGSSGTFLLGFIWGLSQPHVFALTPLMLDKMPLARRFAIDMSSKDSLEFMEFVSFEDGKTVVMFRQFLHTHDQSLPVVACARLHAASQLQQTLGPVLMRANAFEAASCPVCGQAGKGCLCSFDSYAPNTLVRKSTFSWNQFSSQFMRKARSGVIKLRMTAVLPNVGEMCIMDSEVQSVNVLQKGTTDYMNLLRRKAVHGLGINVLVPRADSHVLPGAAENDFLDLHNSYVSRKRVRDPETQDVGSSFLEPDEVQVPETILDISGDISRVPATSESLDSVTVEDVFGLVPTIFQTADSPNPESVERRPRALDILQAPAQTVESPSTSFSAFVRQSSDKLMESFIDPNLTTTPPSTTALTTDANAKPADLLRDIEHILSPEQAPEVKEEQREAPPPTRVSHPSDAQPAVHWTSSISSEDSASDSKTRKTGQRAKRVRATPKRAKPASQTVSESVSEADKKHVCKVCPSRFKMRGDLLRHVKTVHEGKKMYTCQTCGKAFGHSGHLNRHISSVHLQQRRFKCQFCGFQFFQASHLQSHIGHIHSAKKPFECKFCGVRVNSQNALKNHMAKTKCSEAVSMQSVACAFNGCDSKFATQADLDAHNALVHQNFETAFALGPNFEALRG